MHTNEKSIERHTEAFVGCFISSRCWPLLACVAVVVCKFASERGWSCAVSTVEYFFEKMSIKPDKETYLAQTTVYGPNHVTQYMSC
jgi:hypothetical protein